MAGTELGKAYVQIIPSAEGIKGKITEALGGESKSAGKTAGLNIAGAIKSAIATIGIGALIKETFSQGADLQQSIGGIETLFGAGGAKSVEEYAKAVGKSVDEVSDKFDMLQEAQSIAMDNASQAYATAGLSANDYMQTVTGFAAALKSSTENEVEAANVANMAVVDMADNANKMGTSMESIQNAYQGFAKQNYTMLDNLKLGYGGTKSEMERLLADATKLSGVEYNIDNLSDVYKAINVIQTDLGITGTTADEAAKTFSGSMAAMKAAAQNVMGNLFLGEDMGPSMKALAETVSTFLFGNLIPAAANILKGMPSVISSFISAAIPEIAKNGSELISGLASGITEGLPQLLEQMLALVEGLKEFLVEELPAFVESGIDFMKGISAGLMEELPGMIETLSEILSVLWETMAEALPTFLDAGVQFISQMAQGLLQNLPSVITSIGTVLSGLLSYILSQLPALLQKGYELMSSLASGIAGNLPAILSSIAGVIAQLLATIARNMPAILQKGIEIIANIAAGIIRAIPRVIAAIPQVWSNIRSKFSSFDWGSIGSNIISGVANGIRNGVGRIVSAAKDAAKSAFNAAKEFLGIASPSKLFYYLGDMTVEGYTNAIDEGTKPIADTVNEALYGAVSGFERRIGTLSALPAALSSYVPEREEPEDRSYQFSIPVTVDGREIARATATFTRDELNRLQRNQNRKAGYAW